MSMDPNGLDVLQSMIDISAKRLEGLRTQCATNVTLTQEEIRSLEAKLVRMFSDLLVTKSRLLERIPSSGLSTSGPELRQWLRVVGLGQESLATCLQRLSTLEELIEKSDEELKDLLVSSTISKEEETRRLTTATSNLKRCYYTLKDGKTYPENLYWDSWDRQSHHHHYHHRSDFNYGEGGTGVASPRSLRLKQIKVRQSPVTTILSNAAISGANTVSGNLSNISNVTYNSETVQSPSNTTPEEFSSFHGSVHTLTPSPSPPNSPCLTNSSGDGFGTGCNSSGGTGGGGKLGHRKSGTPPPNKKHQTLLSSHSSTPSHKPYPSSGNNNNQNVLKSGLLGSQQAIEQQMNKSKSPETQNLSQEQQQILIQTALNQSTNYSTQNPNNNNISHITNTPRSRLLTESSPDTPSFGSGGAPTNRIISEANTTANNLQVPRSPCTPITGGSMKHTIQHRFTKSIKVSNCDLCQKQMFWGLKCKECKYRCHKDCEPNVPPSCGLPRELFDEFKKTLTNDGFMPANTSPILTNRNPGIGGPGLLTTNQNRRQKTSANYPTHDSSSPGSSCNSSSPSSPALFNHSQQSSQHSSYSTASGSTGGNHHQISTPLSAAHKGINQFNFPDVTVTASHQNNTHILHSGSNSTGGAILTGSLGTHFEKSENYQTSTSISVSVSNCSSVFIGSSNSEKKTGDDLNNSTSGNNQIRPPLSELADTHKSNDSDKTVSLSGSTSASTDSDRTPVRLDSTEEGDSGNWARQHSLSLKEWDIPYDDLKLLEKIGKGRFGTVHRALWHGDVAVKLLKEDYLDDERTLEAFKLEVANFKKTRHENLVLFMGACMKPPYLAIVTSLCKGNTLYTYIHLRKDKFNMSRTTLVAQQISQGMGYLHARGIFHKDLRTKNIFLENGKVIITDFGLFSSTKLIYCDLGLGIPNGWLCYLAPELMRSLTPYKPTDEILPFSRASDVYSFGTVWYELLCGEFPFKIQSPESIIWQVGRGMKQTLANLQTSRDVKDILMLCWSFQADDRPDFPKLLTLLERLPKKRLARSPSHPIQLSRSAESVF
ncbi:kinase suppressor of Ras 2 [Condylostylus longicornis]|uniref:kinase suppressor of Ras 2 n=1 Tax=Condylostylus longicornis TaxID=2530218 RepID=UPI00244DCB88|nr:kinase suppressor of Ras 2 [Condylostylus longicornis]